MSSRILTDVDTQQAALYWQSCNFSFFLSHERHEKISCVIEHLSDAGHEYKIVQYFYLEYKYTLLYWTVNFLPASHCDSV